MRTRDDHLHVATEFRRKRNTVEVLAVRTLVQRTDIEQHDQQDKQTHKRRQTHKHADDLASTFEVGDIRPHGKRKQEAEDESSEVSVVVDPR